MKYLICLLLAHKLEAVETLSPFTKKMQCSRCNRSYGLRRNFQQDILFRWTEGMETSLRIRRRLEQALRGCP